MNEDLFDFILEASPKGLCYCHLANKETWINPEWRQVLGYESTQQSWVTEDFLLKDQLDLIVNDLQGKDFNPSAHYLIDYKHQNGSILKTICTGALQKDSEGRAAALLIAIKQYHQASENLQHQHVHTNGLSKENLNEKLKLSEERFRLAFQHAAIGMAIVSLEGKWLRVNRSLFNILGYRPSELLRLTFQDITHPEDLDKDLNLLNEILERKRDSYQMEKRYLHKEGHIVWVILTVSIVKNSNGEPLHFISQLTDISKVKATELEIQSMMEVTNDQNRRLLNFAHIVSHNLRSHSGNLSMLLNFMETDTNEESRQELFKMFRHATSNLQETVGHLNEVVAVNTTIENLSRINLYEAINCAIGNVEALLKAADAICKNEVKEDVIIDAVPAYLDSILLNFLTNAIKYRSPDRTLSIVLKAETEANKVTLSIQDNGMGIDLALNQDKIFGMYKTFHANNDARGIGLFITKNQIEAMGGKVTLDSEVNVGTTFTIHFKIRE
ncbi:PAS domain S-box protein [Pedobacter sp. ASV1-7]|uniref:sensor histidine kinase n=1 Tax=Pedobacter sp. ASV1-7 TaxID=3145237 RepID=UPI0032E8A856